MKLGIIACAFALLAAAPPPSIQEALNATDLPHQPSASIGIFHLMRRPEQGLLTFGRVPANTKRLVIDAKDVAIAPDGLFAIGFDRDYTTSVLITAFLNDGRNISERIPVISHHWDISVLPAQTQHPTSDSDFQARRPDELAQINLARHTVTSAQGWREHFIWPTHGRVSDLFGSQRVYGTVPAAPHGGVDVAVPVGTPIIAPAEGVVVLAADHPFTLEGNLLMLDHGMGVNSAFLHLSTILVHVGDHVHQGQLIGYSGRTGRATGPHLHWAIKWLTERVDPMTLTGPMH